MANFTVLSNASTMYDLPPLPSYTLYPVKPLISFIPDFYLSLILQIAAYWIVSLFFHYIDVMDVWPQYRLHTPAEILKRNHVSRYEVARDVIVQQIIQTIVGAVLALTEPPEMFGREDYDIARWATRLRIAQRALPQLLGLVGLNAAAISKNVSRSHPMLAGILAGGKYPSLITGLDVVSGSPIPAFAAWEIFTAKALYWYIIPVMQFLLAIVIVDTWQYFLHRAMHMNKWLYTTFHSRHHRLYVPYAFGALYNHPFEGFLLDTLGAAIAFKVAGMTARQGMVFFTASTIKTVDDHSGYTLPWDPLQHITSNNAGYHDIHHQSWGIKTNFSQPFFTFWDRFLGTVWKGDTTDKYERSKKAAQFQVDADKVQ
jgi:sphinganine C4-monooxygenase